MKSKEQATKKVEELQVEVSHLKEEQWLRLWQQIAFHVLQKGIQMASVDKVLPEEVGLPSDTETAKVLGLFDKEIPSSGRI